MKDGVCDGWRSAYQGNLAKSLDAERIDMRVDLIREQHLQLPNVEINRNDAAGSCHYVSVPLQISSKRTPSRQVFFAHSSIGLTLSPKLGFRVR